MTDDLMAEAGRLYRLIEGLLLLEEASRTKLAPDREPVDVSRLVRDLIGRERPLLADHRVVFTGLADVVVGSADATFIQHAVRNLLENAVRYAPSGGPIEVIVVETEDEVVVRVVDGGDHAGTERPVDAFAINGAHQTTTAQRAGAGLGLMVVERLVTAMGGRTFAGGRPGRGSAFGFALPRSA